MNIVLLEENELDIPISHGDERARHLRKILKLNVGDSFRSGVVNSSLGFSTISKIDKDGFHFTHRHTEAPQPLYPIKLVIGTPRPNSVKRVVRESSALGVDEIFFINSDLGEKSYLDSHVFNPKTLRTLLKEGASQAYSTLLPKTYNCSLKEILDIRGHASAFIFDNHPEARKFSDIDWPNTNEGIYLFIGSERGWSDGERRLITNHGLIWSQLGQRVLRSDTAFISAITLAKMRMGYI